VRHDYPCGTFFNRRLFFRAVATEDLDLVGIGLRAPRRDADAVLRGLRRHE